MYTWPVTYHGELIYKNSCQYLQVIKKKYKKFEDALTDGSKTLYHYDNYQYSPH